ncbi:hypothetical protein [Streptomyces atratus]|uniref:DUF7848 domain-containing protein n=1 Tax=Streptomyces atratus TaxID=1893 RepID=A0A2Z5J9J6_STRAR|nr:hypothetical protein [Streptomyces atratus]AXE76565.1 hypothetical protein C5746_06110 [Streptomyces atratus]
MSPRTLIRSVTHRITQHPDADVTYEAECLSCKWATQPSTDLEAVDVECMSHAGRSNHRGFRRVVTGFAFVVRDGE